MAYHQLIRDERYTIARLREKRLCPAQIARVLGRHRSTISREIRRNLASNGRYQVQRAQEMTNGRRRRSRRNLRFSQRQWTLVKKYLRLLWSPEQIANTLKKHGILNISHETIYQYVLRDKAGGGKLFRCLRGANKQRRKRLNIYESRGRLLGKRSIELRPKIGNGPVTRTSTV